MSCFLGLLEKCSLMVATHKLRALFCVFLILLYQKNGIASARPMDCVCRRDTTPTSGQRIWQEQPCISHKVKMKISRCTAPCRIKKTHRQGGEERKADGGCSSGHSGHYWWFWMKCGVEVRDLEETSRPENGFVIISKHFPPKVLIF